MATLFHGLNAVLSIAFVPLSLDSFFPRGKTGLGKLSQIQTSVIAMTDSKQKKKKCCMLWEPRVASFLHLSLWFGNIP